MRNCAINGGVLDPAQFPIKAYQRLEFCLKIYVSKYISFTAIGYTLSGLLSLIGYKLIKSENKVSLWRNIRFGLIASVVHALDWIAMFYALKTGKASVVYPVIHLYIVVTIILAAIFYKEKITIPRIIALLLTIAALFFLQ